MWFDELGVLALYLFALSFHFHSFSLSLSIVFFHTQGLIAEVSDSLPLHSFPFIESLGPIFGLPFKSYSIEFGQRRRKKEFKRDEKVEIIGKGWLKALCVTVLPRNKRKTKSFSQKWNPLNIQDRSWRARLEDIHSSEGTTGKLNAWFF